MSGFAIDGLISNLNTTEIIEALLFSQRAPAVRLENRRTATTNKLSAVQGLSGNVLAVRVAAEGLGNADTFRGRSANSTNSNIVAVSASSAAEPGAFTLSVQQLATALQISSDPNNTFTSQTTALGLEGAIRVNNSTVNIRSTDTLRDIASRISNAGAGVSANVLEVSQGQFRLSIRSLSTGADGFTLVNAGSSNILESLHLAQAGSESIANSITAGAASSRFSSRTQALQGLLGLQSNVPSGSISIANGAGSINVNVDFSTQSLNDIAAEINSAALTAGSSITASAVEVETGSFRLEINSGDGSTPVLTDTNNVLEALGVLETSFTQVDQSGQNSLFKVNGIDIIRSSNTVTDVISGMTMTLLSDDTPDAISTITVQSDSKSAVDAVKAFVSAYNATKTFAQQNASYNAETQRAGILLGDSAILSVESSLSGLLSRSVSTLPSTLLSNLNNGGGVASGSIQITDRSGNTATIDLSSADNLQEVMDLINLDSSIEVEAAVNRSGTGINIRDTSGGSGSLAIAEMGGGTTAADLGILGTTGSSLLEGSAIGTSEFLSLGQIGITVNTNGTLSFNETEFGKVFAAKPDAIQAFFTQKGGFSDQAEKTIDQLTGSISGSLTIRAKSLQDTINSYTKTITGIEERAKIAEERLRRQFSALEKSLSQMQQQSDYLAGQINQWVANSR
ncbi:MAG: flagellar filament capping protein FliD [Candidatus Omnitrophica bacterium]|nr:flagellar filament capping protein FliD [Candidatus Omnitrophota bacterium]